MIRNMLEKIQAEFSRLQEVDYNSTARDVQCQYMAMHATVRSRHQKLHTLYIFLYL